MKKNNIILLALTSLFFIACQSGKVNLVVSGDHSRIAFGMEQLTGILKLQGIQVESGGPDRKVPNVIVGELTDTAFVSYLTTNSLLPDGGLKPEGYFISKAGKDYIIAGADPSGALYGCLELKQHIAREGKLPQEIDLKDEPQMVMRGTCIGLQKPVYLPGRQVYEYPYTPESFPWFYDKDLWIKYLDMMVENRYNALYLWNGHPFASLVKLPDYPYAVEVDDATFEKNKEIFAFLTKEADKRGIWVIQMFYNIIVSKPFAEHHGLKTQDRNRPIIPVIADYTRKSIAAFIENYPNVGLLVTLGEAMNTVEDDVEWFTKTIIPGVQDGLKTLGIEKEPPIVLRGHDTEASLVMDAALPIYKNLYTMFKYNGESLTTYEPRDSWETNHTKLSELGSVHISNVHILANLEPFRYGSPDFIQKSVQAMHRIQGANGLHLYPQASYWDWPWSADKADPRIREMDRNWIWYQAWARYAWNSQRDRKEEVRFWSDELADYYGCGREAGANVLKAYEETGEIAPKLLRTFGISDGNRQTLLLGMFMGQLVNPQKYNVYANFWTSSGPVKEVLQEYAAKEFKGEQHAGETPPQIIDEVVRHGRQAVEAIDKAAPKATKNKEEFERLKNDIYCYDAFARHFAEKVKAAMYVLSYQHSNKLEELDAAVPHLEKSMAVFNELVELTGESYLYANSMQTAQRRIPISGVDGTNKTWVEMQPHYQAELDNFRRNLATLKANGGTVENKVNILEPAVVTVLNPGVTRFELKKGVQVYTDHPAVIEEVASELQKLSGVRFGDEEQQQGGTVLKFRCDKPVKVLVGYFNTNSYSALAPPTLETNANANDRGQADIKIANALLIPDFYPVNVYNYNYEAGGHELVLGKGRVLILGFIDGNEEIAIHDAGMTRDKNGPAVDWLFY